MAFIKKIFRNSASIILGSGIDALFGLVVSILLAQYYGQSDFGTISFLGVFFFLLATIDSMWLRPILVREIAKDESRAARIIGNGMIIRGLLSIVALIFFWGSIYWIGLPGEIIFLAVLSSLNMILSPFIFSVDVVFRAYLNMFASVKIKLASNAVTIALISLVIYLKGGLVHFFIISVISSVFLFFISRHYARRLVKPCFKIDVVLWRDIFIQGWGLGISAFFIFIYHRLDQMMLFHMQGSEATGLYAAGVRLVEWLQIIPLALMSSLFPLMSAAARDSAELFERIYRLSFKYLLMFIIPVAVIGAVFSEIIIVFFYGQQYVLAGTACSILMFAEIFVFLGIVNNAILVVTNKQSLDPVFTGSSVVINIILNFILIPKYGLTGAAIASLAAYATGPVMGAFIPLTRVYSFNMAYYALKPCFASLVMLIFQYLFRFELLTAVVILPFVYILSLYLLDCFDQEDTGFFRSEVL